MDVENGFPYSYIEDDLGEITAWEQLQRLDQPLSGSLGAYIGIAFKWTFYTRQIAFSMPCRFPERA